MKPTLLALLALPLASIGCGHSPVEGTWTRTDKVAQITETATFKADGTFAYDQILPDGTNHPISGKYQIAGTNITIDEIANVESLTTTEPFYVTSSTLGLGVLTPQGAHQGPVGTWQSAAEIVHDLPSQHSDDKTTVIWTISADHKAHVDGSDNGTPYTMDSTWALDQSGNIVINTASTLNTLTLTLIDDQVLSGNTYYR
jgi:hypothetical protein